MPSKKPFHSWPSRDRAQTYILQLRNQAAWQERLREALGQAQTYKDTIPFFTKWNLKAEAQWLKLASGGEE